jgi:hypothetical protein
MMAGFSIDKLKAIHIYIEGGGDDKDARAVLDELHPGLLKFYDGEVIGHAVSPWPEQPFTHAYIDLRLNYDIELSRTNCKVGEDRAFNKRVYLVFYMEG